MQVAKMEQKMNLYDNKFIMQEAQGSHHSPEQQFLAVKKLEQNYLYTYSLVQFF